MAQVSSNSGPESRRSGSRPSLGASLFIAFFALLVGLPILIVGVMPGERDKWLVARAREFELEGENAKAIEVLDELIERSSGDAFAYRVRRIELLLELGNSRRAISEAQAIVDDHPEPLFDIDRESEIGAAYEHYELLARCMQHNGDFSAAADIVTQIQKETKDFESSNMVNSLAYANALADRDLFKSWEAMNEITIPEYQESTLYHMSAYIHFVFLRECGRHFETRPRDRERVFRMALDDLAIAIKDRKRTIAKLESELQAELDERESGEQTVREIDQNETDSESEDSTDDEQTISDERENSVGRLRKNLALMYVHRAQLFELVGDQENADHDWEIVKELGFSRRVLSTQGFDINASVQKLSEVAAWLDTRGFLMYRMKRYRPARNDFNRAIPLMEAMVSIATFSKCQRALQSPDVRLSSLQLRQMERLLGVMVYHRYKANVELGDTEAAAIDLERLEELGLEAGDHLF